MRFFLVIYFSLNALLSFGNWVSIAGNALFFAREIITLYQLENGISMEKKELAQTVMPYFQ